MKGFISKLNLSRQYKKAEEKINALYQYLKIKMNDMAIWTIQLIAGYLFACIAFPATVFIVFYLVTKNLVRYVIGIQRRPL